MDSIIRIYSVSLEMVVLIKQEEEEQPIWGVLKIYLMIYLEEAEAKAANGLIAEDKRALCLSPSISIKA